MILKTQQDTCPKCKKELAAVMNPTGMGIPKKGDYTVCVFCCAILKFGDGLELLLCPLKEVMSMDNHIYQELRGYIDVINQAKLKAKL